MFSARVRFFFFLLLSRLVRQTDGHMRMPNEIANEGENTEEPCEMCEWSIEAETEYSPCPSGGSILRVRYVRCVSVSVCVCMIGMQKALGTILPPHRSAMQHPQRLVARLPLQFVRLSLRLRLRVSVRPSAVCTGHGMCTGCEAYGGGKPCALHRLRHALDAFHAHGSTNTLLLCWPHLLHNT